GVDGTGPGRGRRAGRLDGGPGQRHGPPEGDRQLRARPRRMARLRLRHRSRPAGDADIRHGRPARLLRRRYPLAQALRLPRARRADLVGRGRRMKFSYGWLKDHLDTDASAEALADKLTNIGLEVENLSNPA